MEVKPQQRVSSIWKKKVLKLKIRRSLGVKSNTNDEALSALKFRICTNPEKKYRKIVKEMSGCFCKTIIKSFKNPLKKVFKEHELYA
jgi:hypothetical protein